MKHFKELELNNSINYLSNKLDIQSIVYALTSKCNMNCTYCGAYHPVNNEKILDLKDVLHKFDEIPNFKRLKLSGGEVTLEFNKCLEICQYCSCKNIFLQLNTNTTLLNEEKLYQLKEAGLKTIHISLNFLDAESYKKYYGQNYFELLIKNIKLANEIFHECIVESLLCSDTINSILDVSKLLKSIGIKKHEIQYGVSNPNWENSLNINDLKKLIFELINNACDDYDLYFTCFDINKKGEFWECLHQTFNPKYINFTTCIDGRFQIHMAPNGDLVICDLGFPYLIGNIMEIDFGNIIITDELKYFYDHHNCGKRIKLI